MKYMIPIRIPAHRGVDFRECKAQNDFCVKSANKSLSFCWVHAKCPRCMFSMDNKSHFDKWIKEVNQEKRSVLTPTNK